MALAEQAQLVAHLSLKDDMSKGIAKARGGLKGLNDHFARTRQSLSQTSHNFKLLGAGIIGAGVVAVKWAVDFQAQMNTINTVAQVTPTRLDAIGKSIIGLAEKTGTGIADLTSAYYDLVSAGISAADAQDVLVQANELAIGGLGTTKEAVDLLTTAINAYGGDAKKAADYTDYLSQAVAEGKVTTSQLAGSFSQVAIIASTYKIGVDQLAASFGYLTQQGMAAGDVAAYMRQAISALIKPNSALLALQKQSGHNYADMIKHGMDFVDVLAILRSDTVKFHGNLGAELGRIQALQYVLGTTGQKYHRYRKILQHVRDSTKGLTESQRLAQERMKGAQFDWNTFKNTLQGIGIQLGTAILPALSQIGTAISTSIGDHQADIDKFAEALAKLSQPDTNILGMPTKSPVESGIQGVLTFLEELPWDAITRGFQMTVDIAGKAVDIFKSLPPGVQSGLITLLAANKLTGGLIASFGHDLAGLALASLKTITAMNVTVIGTNVTGPGGGTPTGGNVGLGGWASFLMAPAALATVAAATSLVVNTTLDQMPNTPSSDSAKANINRASGTSGIFSDTFAKILGSLGDGINTLTGLFNPNSPDGQAWITTANNSDVTTAYLAQLMTPITQTADAATSTATNTDKAGGSLGDIARLFGVNLTLDKLAGMSDKKAIQLAALQTQKQAATIAAIHGTTGAVKAKQTVVNVKTTLSVSARAIASEVSRVVVGNRYVPD